ncbi:hypothetical protein L6452_36832 [Arctium lappa]|uniref:Uncharacterized protein n=1 Tax=Arctium lappa TaxID=4217 RepID=A0ACB8Y201_ARCLA|nr:hypothetical protein L6452_36832 [Arctium lappa]
MRTGVAVAQSDTDITQSETLCTRKKRKLSWILLIMASGSGDPTKPTGTTEASSCTETLLKRNSGDAVWNYAQSWIVAISDEEEEMEEGGTSEARDHEARELHEDDFESDEEPQVEGQEIEIAEYSRDLKAEAYLTDPPHQMSHLQFSVESVGFLGRPCDLARSTEQYVVLQRPIQLAFE